MSETDELAATLQALGHKWEEITAVPESPRSLMNVIEYSLGSQQKAEVYVNRLLRYFLDPEEPHGMGTEFLTALLEGLPRACEFQEDIHDLSDVQVDDQVRIRRLVDGDTESTGRLDLCIEVPNEWFLLIELKFAAEDTQTKFYYRNATHIDGRPKDDYESGQYYVYLHPADRPTANEPAFTNWTWQAFIDDIVDPFLMENAPRYPQRTTTQFRELTDDIQTIAGMTDHQRHDQEKIALYLDHYEAITDVTEAFDDRWEAFSNEWATDVAAVLAEEDLATYSTIEEDIVAVELGRSESERREWTFRTTSSDWGMIFKHGWWRHTGDLTEILYGRPDDRNDVRIGFHHRLERNRDLAIRDNTLKLYFRNMGANDQTFKDHFADAFAEHRSDIADRLPQNADITGNKLNLTVATYDIRPDAHEDFFAAYTAALKRAVVDHVIEANDLIDTIDELYRHSIQEVYGVSVDLL